MSYFIFKTIRGDSIVIKLLIGFFHIFNNFFVIFNQLVDSFKLRKFFKSTLFGFIELNEYQGIVYKIFLSFKFLLLYAAQSDIWNFQIHSKKIHYIRKYFGKEFKMSFKKGREGLKIIFNTCKTAETIKIIFFKIFITSIDEKYSSF